MPQQTERTDLLETGTILHGGKWEIRSLVGEGGMGTVYRVRHTEMREMEAAIKMLHLRDDPDMRDRFIRESEVLARVKSQHVVRIMDRGVYEDAPYIVMELLQGHDWHEEIKDAPRHQQPVARVAEVALGAVIGLRALHEWGILHRDIKPSNIFLHDGEEGEVVKIFDFGISSIPYGAAITVAQMYTGSPAFSSPEQLRAPATGDIVDVRTDQFSLAVSMFLALTGELPWGIGAMRRSKSAEDSLKFRRAQIRGDYLRLDELRGDVPPALVEAIHKALAVDPEQRFARIEEFGKAIQPFAPELPRSQFERSLQKSRPLLRAEHTVPVPVRRGAFAPSPSAAATLNAKAVQELPSTPSKAPTRLVADIPTRVVNGTASSPSPSQAIRPATAATVVAAEAIDPLDATLLEEVVPVHSEFTSPSTEEGAFVDASEVPHRGAKPPASPPPSQDSEPRLSGSRAARSEEMHEEMVDSPEYQRAIAALVGNTKVLPSGPTLLGRSRPRWLGPAVAVGAAGVVLGAVLIASFQPGAEAPMVPAEELRLLNSHPAPNLTPPPQVLPAAEEGAAARRAAEPPAPAPAPREAPSTSGEPAVVGAGDEEGEGAARAAAKTPPEPAGEGVEPRSKPRKKRPTIIYTPNGSPILPP